MIDRTIAEHGALWFDEVEYECCARGVFKIDLMDFNQDGTEELVMLYNNEESIFPLVDITEQKAFLIGTYHGRCTKLQAYLDEYCFRFNRRMTGDQIFLRLTRAVATSCGVLS